ncbi:MAG: hemoglobin [Urechidicola sp.]|jgi:hemoglobin
MLNGCQSFQTSPTSLYDDLGSQQGLEKIVDQLIIEKSLKPAVEAHFKDSNMDRFKTKLVEHLCVLSGGNCTYTGDTMVDVHTGMKIKKSEFNALVEALINAMDKVGIANTTQNRLLMILAKLRPKVINI